MEEIILFHTNDLHSHLENWPKIRRYIIQKRQQYEKEGKTVLTLDIGDFIDRWHPLTEATNGKANVVLMNQLNYDATTIGNNEGIGYSKDELNHLYDEGNFDVIIGNIVDLKTKKQPKWARRYKIIETKQGTKLGILALTAPFPLTYNPNGWDSLSVNEVLPQLIEEITPKCDSILLMSHLGIHEDQKIAETYPQIQVIIGSHTHHVFPYGKKIKHVQLAAAGKFGFYIGEISLKVAAGKLIFSSAQAILTKNFEETIEDKQEIASFMALGHKLLQEKKVAYSPFHLSIDVNAARSLLTETFDAIKKRANTNVAILNSGLFLKSIPQGMINEDQLHQALPHPMHLIRVTLTGRNFVRLIQEMEKNREFLRKFPVVGMGFRGKIFGDICYSGIEFDRKNQVVYWLGKAINPEEEYSFTTVDHFAFVPFFPTIEIAGKLEFLFPEFLREVVSNYLKHDYPIK